MEIVKECGTSILSTIVEDLVKSAGRQVGYIFRVKSIIEDLNKEAESLRLAQGNMQHRVDGAMKDTEEIEKDVEKWLRDVTTVVAEAEDLEKQSREKKTCLNGLCPNLIWRYQMAKRAQKKMSIMVKLKDGGKFDNVSHRTTLSSINVLTPKDFMLFESTTYTFNLIIEALKDDKTNVVGLYGMGGVGKTTLAKAVVKKAKEEKIFNEVVMVVVSNRDINKDEDNLSAKIRDIQGQLADFLNLKLQEESKEGRAGRLKKRLENEKKILIILDDIWEKIDLEIIGIPVDDHHKDCKIFLTTRQKQVCIDMGCQSRIPLDVLNEEEGLVLFKRHAGLHDVHSPTTIKLAKEVVEECKGLPLAIVTIGSALKEKDINEWKIVTQKLKKSKLMDADIVDAKLYACLKLSYDYLKNDKTKFCFLICSLFPEDHEIDLEELVRYGLGLGLYQNTDSIEEARSELHVMVNNLKASSLLLDAKEGHVKMHDVVRDVALWITSKGEEVFMVKAGMGLAEWPKHEVLEQCTSISLMGNKIEVLPEGLVCPKLKIFLLDSYIPKAKFWLGMFHSPSCEVLDEFFEKMKALKVLSLGGWNLSLNSLRFLTNLVTLQLFSCKLRDISSLKKLSKLEILNLKGSKFVELPEELGELSKLRMLDIRDCGELKRIPANVIPRLSRLEELYIGGRSFKAWEVEGTSAERSNASLSELYQLNHLTILSLNINVQPCLSKDFVLLTKLLRYEIRVNYDSYDWPYDWPSDSYPISRLLKIRDIGATSLVAFKELYKNVEYLGLVGIKGCCQNMVPSIDETGLNELKRLSLERFAELECIIDTTQQQDVASTAFSNLVDLSLWSCDGLREICSGGRPPRGFLENLETLYIARCDNMSSLFPSWVLIQRLRKLKKVTVDKCQRLLVVCQLEGLSYAKENPFLLSSLESLDLQNLENLRYIWDGPTQQVSLQSLTVVEVKWCNKLRYLFTLSLARSLLQLEELKVRYCYNLEHIVEIKEAEENVVGGGGNDIMFPKLRRLRLFGLKNFINFYSENSSLNMKTAKEPSRDFNLLRSCLQNLEELNIEECGGVQVLFQLESLEQELTFPSLKVLELKYQEELECLCRGPMHILSLPNLKKLEVYWCKRLRHMFSPSLARNLLRLEELSIWSCGELEYIVSIKAEENVGGGGGNDVMLPKLRILRLSEVENFIDFYLENLSLNVLTTKKQLRGLRHGLPNLEELHITRCGVQVLFDLEGLEQELVFPSLKVLELEYLKQLECLCKGPTHLLSLPNLKKLKVWSCDKLRHMFSPSLARNLLQLEELIIEECEELEYIVSIKAEENVGGGGGNGVMLPKLRILKLAGLENFIDFYSENLSLNEQTGKKQLRGLRHGLQNLEELNIISYRVQVLFHLEGLEQELAFPNLKVLELKYLKELECLCRGSTHLLSLPNLKKLEVWSCNRLRHVFSPSLARNLLQLEELIIECCGELECIVSIKAEENVGGGGGNDVMLPKLRILRLHKLENFINLYSENSSLNVLTTKKQLPNLEELYISWCGVQVLFHLEGLKQELTFPSLKVLELGYLEQLECLYKGPTHLLSLPNLKKLKVWSCYKLRHMFSPSLARNLLQLEELSIWCCGELEQIFIEDDAAEYNQTLSKDHLQWPLLFPNLSRTDIWSCDKLKSMFPVNIAHLLSLQNLTTLKLSNCHELTHLFSSTTLVRNLLRLESIDITDCKELEQIIVEDDATEYNQTLLKDHLQSPLLFPNLSSVVIQSCPKLKSMFPVSMTHLLSLQNLTTLRLQSCPMLTHLFSSTTLVRNLLRLESIGIKDCGELEQIIVEDHTEDDHVQLGLFPNLSSISINRCGKLKTLFPDVTIARSGLQKLRTLNVENSFQLEELFGYKDKADMTSHREMVLPQLEKLSLEQLASLINFCPVGYHFIFPSLSRLVVSRCPKINTRFSVDQNRSVHAEVKAPQTGKEDVDMEQSPPETTREIYCRNPDDLRKQLPPYIGK